MLGYKPAFSLSSFTLIKRLFSSSSLSAIRVTSPAYLRLLTFLLAILIPACASSSPAFHMRYSAYKLDKQGDKIQHCDTPFPIFNQSAVPCPVLTVASQIGLSPVPFVTSASIWSSTQTPYPQEPVPHHLDQKRPPVTLTSSLSHHPIFVLVTELVNIWHCLLVHLYACQSPLEWKLPENRDFPSDGPLQTLTISIDTDQWNTPNIKKQICCKADRCPQVSQMPQPHSFFPNMLGKWYSQDLNPGLQSPPVYHRV